MTSDLSLRAQISGLEVGECVSRSQRIEMGVLNSDAFREQMDKLRSSMQPHVRRATEETGRNYKIEGGHWITRSGHVVLNVIVTRESGVQL